MTKTVKSIRVEEELWRKAKIHSIEKGITLSSLIEKLLREELKKHPRYK